MTWNRVIRVSSYFVLELAVPEKPSKTGSSYQSRSQLNCTRTHSLRYQLNPSGISVAAGLDLGGSAGRGPSGRTVELNTSQGIVAGVRMVAGATGSFSTPVPPAMPSWKYCSAGTQSGQPNGRRTTRPLTSFWLFVSLSPLVSPLETA